MVKVQIQKLNLKSVSKLIYQQIFFPRDFLAGIIELGWN